jgi:polyferredoxin
MTSRTGFANWLLTYGGWIVLAVLAALWVLPVPRSVRILVTVTCFGLSVCMHIALQRRRRAEGGGRR